MTRAFDGGGDIGGDKVEEGASRTLEAVAVALNSIKKNSCFIDIF